MSLHYKAAVLHQARNPLAIEEVTAATLAPSDVLVRVRGHHDRNDPDAPVAPDLCTPPPGGGEPVCDIDITGRIDHDGEKPQARRWAGDRVRLPRRDRPAGRFQDLDRA